jgi:hypothetical protein
MDETHNSVKSPGSDSKDLKGILTRSRQNMCKLEDCLFSEMYYIVNSGEMPHILKKKKY